jgi:ferredoxin-NADP reductase
MPQKLPCRVTEVIDHGERVYSVLMKPGMPAPRFLAGQFLHLALDEYMPGDYWPDSRVFSIASPPSERQLLRITYAVKGQFTGRMETELRPGVQVWVKMPYGEFTLSDDGEVCLLAGGTGVTAFTAFLSGLTEDHMHPVHLFYGVRLPSLLIYRPLLGAAVQRCPALKVRYFAEQEAEGSGCLPGRIDLAEVWNILPDPLAVSYYLSGPPEMLQALRGGLLERGVEPGRVRIDAWE